MYASKRRTEKFSGPGKSCQTNVTDLAGSLVIAKFHYTGRTGAARTRTDFVGDPHGPNGVLGDPGRKKVRAGPVGPV